MSSAVHLVSAVSRRAGAFALLALLLSLLLVGPGCEPPPNFTGDDGGTGGDLGSGGGAGTGGGATGGSATGGGSGWDGGTVTTRNVRIIVEPSDNGSALKNAITGATSSVHMVMYILSNSAIVDALIAQKNAGREVQVLLNRTFPNGAGSNQAVFTQLQSAGVDVRWASSTFNLVHEKCVIVDKATAWIMTMNVTQTSAGSNREYLAVDTEPADVEEAEAIFQADFNGTPAPVVGALAVAPDNAHDRLVALLNSATSTLDLEAEVLSDPQVANALIIARSRGVRVRVVVSADPPSAAQDAAVVKLKAAGVQVRKLANPYMHAKSIVADGKTAYVGSENFTQASLDSNRELGVIFNQASEVSKVLSTTTTDFNKGIAL